MVTLLSQDILTIGTISVCYFHICENRVKASFGALFLCVNKKNAQKLAYVKKKQ